MKYLKYFENNHQYYYEIEFSEFYEERIHIKFTESEERQLENIVKIANNGKKLYDLEIRFIAVIDGGVIGAKFDEMVIKKCDDEWFCVNIINGINYPGYTSTKGDDLYFKCDQFDGLIKLIEDFI